MEEQKIELKIINMADIQSQEIEWLWYPFIPYGKLTIIQGDPGDGKTTLVLNLAAKLSKGIGLDEDMQVSEPMNIIYQIAEDGLADTVKPRLEAADADCEKIMVIDESEKSLSMVDERLEQAIIQTNTRLLILDPIQAYLGGGMDMNRANEARDMTKKLGLLAEKYKCAIILIGHMNKAAGNKAAYRGMGSIDFFAVARSVLLVGRIEGQENTRAVVQIKNNLAAFGHPKAFELTEGDYEITADELLGGVTPKANKKERAKQLIYELSETNNVVKSEDIVNLAEEKGISIRTKKEICNGDGSIRDGCNIIKKGEVYERKLFGIKDTRFKSEQFLEEVKHSYTDLINLYVRNDTEKLKVFERGGVYLATKKIGKNNPKAEQIEADNEKRQAWNHAVDRALVGGVPEQQILAIKKSEISNKVKVDIAKNGKQPERFSNLILMAIAVLELLMKQVFKRLY